MESFYLINVVLDYSKLLALRRVKRSGVRRSGEPLARRIEWTDTRKIGRLTSIGIERHCTVRIMRPEAEVF